MRSGRTVVGAAMDPKMAVKDEIGGGSSAGTGPSIHMKDLPNPENILKCMPMFSGNASDWVFWSSRLKGLLSFYNVSHLLEVASNQQL